MRKTLTILFFTCIGIAVGIGLSIPVETWFKGLGGLILARDIAAINIGIPFATGIIGFIAGYALSILND